MSDFRDRLLAYYSLNDATWNDLIQLATSDSLVAFSSYPGAQQFERVLNEHLNKNNTILIYGDYDADGMFSSAILYDTLKQRHARVSVYLPQRYQDGYGLTLKQAKRFVEEHYRLVICIDNGVSQHEAITYLVDHDVDVLVMDHHHVSETPPPYKALIHPEFNHPDPLARCSASLALSFSIHMLKKVIDQHVIFAAIATMTDSMPLLKDNRRLVKLGIEAYNRSPIPSLIPFVTSHPITETMFSMVIGPTFNAIGRMGKDDLIQSVVPYLVGERTGDASNIAERFKAINSLRKERSHYWAQHFSTVQEPIIVDIISDVSGLTGLIASRLLSDHIQIAGIFAKDEKHPDHLVGSFRSATHLDMYAIINNYPGSLIAFGGHPQACGVTLHMDEWASFQTYIRQSSIQTSQQKPIAIPIQTKEITWANYELIQLLAPFGPGLKEPVFQLSSVPVEKLTFTTKSPYYLSTRLTPFSEVFSFVLTKPSFSSFNRVDLIGTLRLNVYKDSRKIQFVVSTLNSL
jgi:single-stranded-DNA-specific exonuclease